MTGTQKNTIHKEILKRLESNDLNYERWIDPLSEILEIAVKIFGVGTTYSIHSCINEGQTIHFETGGPSEEPHYEKRKDAEDRGIDKGLIGKTIKENQSYRIYNDVQEWKDSYISNNPDTVSELVVLIPNFSSDIPLGVINLESNVIIESNERNERGVFNEEGGLIFSMIANWVGQLHIRKEDELRINKILSGLALLPADRQAEESNYSRRDNTFRKLARLSNNILISDAFAISLFERDQYFQENQYLSYKIIAHENYPKRLLELTVADQRRSVPAYTFRDHERSTETFGEPTIHQYEAARNLDLIESSIDSRLTHFLSICFYYNLENSRKVAALILGFKKNPNANEKIKHRLKSLTKIVTSLTYQLEIEDDRKTLLSAIKNLSEFSLYSMTDMGSFLSKIAEQIADLLHCSGCIFYDLKGDENLDADISLNELGSHIRERSNIFWKDYFKMHLELFKKLKNNSESYKEFPIKIKSGNDSQNQEQYNVFIRSVNLHKKVIFVSLKKLRDHHEYLILSDTNRAIMDAKIITLESFMHNRLRENSTKYSLLGFEKLIGIWLEKVCVSVDKRKGGELELFTAIHSFLENWSDIAGTPYSAIFLSSGASLEMSEASMQHLKCHGQAPLKFSAEQIGRLGLTQMVWKKQESILSFSVTSDGNEECRNFWQTITNTTPDQRFFAGVVIKHEDCCFGVLTINGNQPIYNITQFSMSPSILPMLEIIAKELGKQLHIARSWPAQI